MFALIKAIFKSVSHLSVESSIRHRSVGICYLLDKCVHALIDDIYIDTA